MNEITDRPPESATSPGTETTAREALTGAQSGPGAFSLDRARLLVLADILGHHERHSAEIRARLTRPVAVSDHQALAAVLDHHEARRAAQGARSATCTRRARSRRTVSLARLLKGRTR